MSKARQRIIDTATHLFAENGYAAVGMRDLAVELDRRAPTIYSHFPSKSDLLLACLQPLVERVDNLLSQPVSEPESNARKVDWLTAYILINIEYRAPATILVTDRAARADPRVASLVQYQSQRVAAMLEFLGSPDQATTTAILGAIYLPIIEGSVEAANAGKLAASLVTLLEPASRALVMSDLSF